MFYLKTKNKTKQNPTKPQQNPGCQACSGPRGHYLHLCLRASLLQQGRGDKGYMAAAAATLSEPPLPASSDTSLVIPQERSCLRGEDLSLKYHQATAMRRGETWFRITSACRWVSGVSEQTVISPRLKSSNNFCMQREAILTTDDTL